MCPNDEMTQHLLEAMKADKFSEIVYRLEQVRGGGRADPGDGHDDDHRCHPADELSGRR